MTKIEPYLYQPSPEDLANFEAVWAMLWHPRFKNMPVEQYGFVCQFAFEVFITGINQHKADIVFDLKRSLDQS